MRRIGVLLIALLFLATVAASGTQWYFASSKYGANPPDLEPSVYYDDETIVFRVDSDEANTAAWRLYTIFESPDTSYELTFDARSDAPNIDLDGDKIFGYGADDGINNDGPNIFAYMYSENVNVSNFTYNQPGVQLTSSSFFGYRGDLCHIHRECNYFGPTNDQYTFCDSADVDTYQGWVYDAAGFSPGVGDTNEVNAPALENNEWKTIRLNVDSMDCGNGNVTIAIVGLDYTRYYPYAWEIKNVAFTKVDTTELLFDAIYIVDDLDGDGEEDGDYELPGFCGDKRKQDYEECDDTDGVDTGWMCTADCKLEEICGDNEALGNEACDGRDVTSGYICSDTCDAELPVCGDEIIVAGEMCDGTEVTAGFECSGTCDAEVPICGDGLLVGSEPCDGMNGTDSAHGCSDKCTLYRMLTENEDQIMDDTITMMLSSTEGTPAFAEFVFMGPANMSVDDIQDQLYLRSSSIPDTTNITFCTAETSACEAEYTFGDKFFVSNDVVTVDDEVDGLMKVYVSGEDYYIGFKPNPPGLIPKIKMDEGFWLVVGFIVLAIVTLVIVVVGAIVLLGYMKAKRVSSRTLMRRVGLK